MNKIPTRFKTRSLIASFVLHPSEYNILVLLLSYYNNIIKKTNRTLTTKKLIVSRVSIKLVITLCSKVSTCEIKYTTICILTCIQAFCMIPKDVI